MNFRLHISVFFILNFILSARAQLILSGKVIDPVSRETLPYVNIGIKNKNIGTISQSDGSFSLTIPANYQNDSLTFSLVGYSKCVIPIQTSGQKLIPLLRKAGTLDEVIITPKSLKEKKFGLSKRNALIHFLDGSVNQNDIFEIAQLIKLPSTPSKLNSLKLYINESNADSCTFRINFYRFDGHNPTERLLEKSIVQTHAIKEGWLTFDLSAYKIFLKNEVVVSIEFLPAKLRKSRILYEIKLGGSTKSFVRKSSQGEWVMQPHHYLMHITAFVETGKSNTEEEQAETRATKKMYSKFVKDSFSLFIKLPGNYKKNETKTYPVVYVLDANAYFDLFVNTLEHLTKNKNFPECILVGIGYKNVYEMDSLRQRDYTYPVAAKKDSCRICGGAELFRNFIQQELISHIAKTYREDSGNRTLVGHSLGGYFTLFSLEKDLREQNNSFKNYLALSPSLDYADKYILQQFQHLENRSPAEKTKKLYTCFGDLEDKEDGGKGTEGADNFKFLIQELSQFKGIQLKDEILSGLGHMETVVPGFEKGLLISIGE